MSCDLNYKFKKEEGISIIILISSSFFFNYFQYCSGINPKSTGAADPLGSI
jgi:hypothetical protein